MDELAIPPDIAKHWAKELFWAFLRSLIPVITGMLLMTAINFRIDITALQDEYALALTHCTGTNSNESMFNPRSSYYAEKSIRETLNRTVVQNGTGT